MTPDQPDHPHHLDLMDLLLADLPRTEVASASRHLEGCEDCRASLAELAVGHALLARSARVLADPAPAPAPAPASPAPLADRSALPPLPRLPRGRSRGVGLGLLVAACLVLALAAGALTAGLLDRTREDPVPQAAPTRVEPLDPVAGRFRASTGEMAMSQPHDGVTRVRISTDGLPEPAAGGFYEAWLLDPTTQKMLPLGPLGPQGAVVVELDDALLARYGAVDISLERDDGDPQHSPTSVLRGAFT